MSRTFNVRDISDYYEDATFDVVFYDYKESVLRYSDEVFFTFKEAWDYAERLETSNAKPRHWEVWQEVRL